MMKRFTILFFALACSFTTVWGAYGIFEAGVTIDGFTYVEGPGTSLQGQAFSVAQNGTLNLTYAYVKTFKNGGSDVCGANLNYAVYPAAGAPSFTTTALCFDFNIGGGGDQQWSSGPCPLTPVNLAAGLTPGNYKIAVYYSAAGGSCPAVANTFLSNSGANYIADLTIGLPLSINLTAFDARRMETGVELNWQTATERNQASYEIERRATNGGWLTLGSVKSHGNAIEAANYTFTDANPLTSDSYYRLAMKDLEGKTTYSSVVRVEGKYTSAWQVAPNPATDELVLRFVEKDAPENATIRMYNAQGMLALEYQTNGVSTRIPLTGLSAGTYWLEIQSGDGVRTALQQVIKQ